MMNKKIEKIEQMSQVIRSVYSLSSIEEHFYKLRLMLVREAKSHQEMDRIMDKVSDCLYFFEIIYEGDYAEAVIYGNVLDEECQNIAFNYFSSLYESLVIFDDAQIESHYHLYQALLSKNSLAI